MEPTINSQPISQQPVHSKPQPKRKPWLPVIIVVLVLLVVSGSFSYALKNSHDELTTAKTQTISLQSQIAALKSQLIPLRDARRKQDLAAFADVIRSYNASVKGHLTTEGSTAQKIYQTQLSKAIPNFNDPTTKDQYTFEAVAPVQTPSKPKIGLIQYQWPAKCGVDGSLVDTSDQTLTAIETLLENGTLYCLSV